MENPRSERRRSRRLMSAWALVALASISLAACSAGGGDDAPTSIASSTTTTSSTTSSTVATSTSSTTSSTTDPAASEEQAILDRYLLFWEVRFEANSEPVDPSDPRLADLATGAQLDNVIAETQRRADNGLALRRPDESVTERRPRIVSVDQDVATIQDCAINDSIVYRIDTGEVVDDSIVTRSVSATMRRIDGTWRLEGAQELQKWEGVAGCALASDS